MLVELRVENFALVEKVVLNLGSGFNVLTGETGAGKSIIVDAMQAAIGQRLASDLVRQGAERAVVEAVFDIGGLPAVQAKLQEIGFGIDEQEPLLILTREIYRHGRSTMRVNHRVVSASAVRETVRALVDLHGQHENQTILEPEYALGVLDAFAGSAAAELSERVASLWRRRHDLDAEIQSLAAEMRERVRLMDLLRHQKNEIDSAEVRLGEDEELEAERRRLSQFERLLEGVCGAHFFLYGSGDSPSVIDLLSRASDEMARLAELDPELGSLRGVLEEALIQLREASREIAGYRDRLDADPDRLAAVDDRLAVISGLKRKYGSTVEEILSFGQEAAAELERLEIADQTLDELKGMAAKVTAELTAVAGELTAIRLRTAAGLSEAVTEELQQLNLIGSTLEFRLEPLGDGEIGPRGGDRCGIYFSANRGEHPRLLSRVASGGELSRVALGLRTVLAGCDSVDCLIFDEIDSGLGGRTAVAVGERLVRLSSGHQVISVTHLPQVAAMADRHFRIYKDENGGRTMVKVSALTEEERCAEVARMLSGDEQSSLARHHARELIDQGCEARRRCECGGS